MRARRRLYRALSTLQRLKQKTHRRLRGPSRKKRFERGFGNCSVAAKCAKKKRSLWFYSPPAARGERGVPRKSKVESLFSGGRDDDDPRIFNTTLINNESARESDTNFSITFALAFFVCRVAIMSLAEAKLIGPIFRESLNFI